MIFCAKNEKGEPTWQLAKEGRKTVTRRPKPLPVGKEFAIQPGRGKFAVCRGRVISCMSHREWILSEGKPGHIIVLGTRFLDKEAKKEGFDSWVDLVDWFNKRKQKIENMFRIEFELVIFNRVKVGA